MRIFFVLFNCVERNESDGEMKSFFLVFQNTYSKEKNTTTGMSATCSGYN